MKDVSKIADNLLNFIAESYKELYTIEIDTILHVYLMKLIVDADISEYSEKWKKVMLSIHEFLKPYNLNKEEEIEVIVSAINLIQFLEISESLIESKRFDVGS